MASLTLALEAASILSANLKTIIFDEKKPQAQIDSKAQKESRRFTRRDGSI